MTLCTGVIIFAEHWGNNLQFYPNFSLFSTLGGMNLDHDFAQVSKLSEDQKKVCSKNGTHFFGTITQKMEHIFSLNSSGHLHSDAQQNQIIGGVHT